MKNKPLHIRMTYALNGLALAFRSEKSVRFQILVAIAVICLLGLVQPPIFWWVIILMMISLVLLAELVNTAIEGVCDFVQPNHSEHIKKIKDVSAGAVFIISMCSVVVGLLFIIDIWIS